MEADLQVQLEHLQVMRERQKKATADYNISKLNTGIAIRKYRKENNISLKQVADKVICSVAFLSDIELGRRFPSEEVLKEIVKALKSSPNKLI